MPNRERALVNIVTSADMMERWRTTRDGRIRDAVRAGLSLREVGRAAGVDASTVKRIAARQKK